MVAYSARVASMSHSVFINPPGAVDDLTNCDFDQLLPWSSLETAFLRTESMVEKADCVPAAADGEILDTVCSIGVETGEDESTTVVVEFKDFFTGALAFGCIAGAAGVFTKNT